MMWARLVLRAALIFVHCFVLILVILSIIEMFKTICSIIRYLEKDNEVLLAGALVAVLVPSGAMLFWGCNAIAVQFDLPIRRVCRFFRNQSKI
jgi:hypothetical protein